MSTYRKAILVFGVVFATEESAIAFCRDQHEDDELNGETLGLEYFDDGYYILGFQMQPGETVDKYQLMWNAHCFDTKVQPEAMLDIRTW